MTRIAIWATDPLIGGQRIIELGSGATLAEARAAAASALVARGYPSSFLAAFVACMPAFAAAERPPDDELGAAIRAGLIAWSCPPTRHLILPSP